MPSKMNSSSKDLPEIMEELCISEQCEAAIFPFKIPLAFVTSFTSEILIQINYRRFFVNNTLIFNLFRIIVSYADQNHLFY